VRCPDLFGADGVRVVPQRTSNAYHFDDPGGEGAASNSASAFDASSAWSFASASDRASQVRKADLNPQSIF